MRTTSVGRVRARTTEVLAAAVTVSLLAACGGGEEPAGEAQAEESDPALSSLVGAAQEEGSVVWYSAVPQAASEDVAEGFEAEYDIPVELLQMPGSRLLERFSSEASAGAFNADVIVGTGLEKAAAGDLGQWIDPVRDQDFPAVADFPSDFIRDNTAVVSYIPWVIAYNTDLVDEADVPESFEDLADPRWRGQLATTDPSASTAYVEVWDRLMSEYGEDFLEAYGENEPRLFDSAAAANEALAAGEVAIGAPTTASALAVVIEAGAPIEYVEPPVTTGAEMQLALVSAEEAAHPNAARLFANFLMTPEGNETVAVGGDVWVLDPSREQDAISALSPAEDAASRRDQVLGLLDL